MAKFPTSMQVGETGAYALEKGWRPVCKLPQTVALEWALVSAPQAIVGVRHDDRTVRGAASYSGAAGYAGWENKKFVVVQVDHIGTFAIYIHDGEWWLVKQAEATVRRN